MKTRGSRPADSQPPGLQSRADVYEVEILNGLKNLCRAELQSVMAERGRVLPAEHEDSLSFEFAGGQEELLGLRIPVAVFQLLYFKVPRPQGVVQGGHAKRLFEAISRIGRAGNFETFRISAAGGDSPVFEKIKSLIAQYCSLRNDEEDGQMVIRFRRSRLKRFGWDVLIRLSKLPLSARSWRKENFAGALNASIAAAMLRLAGFSQSDRVLNLMCGSGTFLAECAQEGGAAKLSGIDISEANLRLARANLAEVNRPVLLVHADARRLPFDAESHSLLVSDLPWGRRVGEKNELESLYARSLQEAARVCASGGRFALITQENVLMDRILESCSRQWKLKAHLRVKQGEYRPKIYLLQRL